MAQNISSAIDLVLNCIVGIGCLQLFLLLIGGVVALVAHNDYRRKLLIAQERQRYLAQQYEYQRYQAYLAQQERDRQWRIAQEQERERQVYLAKQERERQEREQERQRYLEELARQQEQERQRQIALWQTLQGLLALSPTEFEYAIGEALEAQGYCDVCHTGGAGDLGADLTARTPDGHSVVVQCKRYAPAHFVGSPEIQKFIGMVKIHHNADQGLSVTTSSYTRPALDLAYKHSDYLQLYDGEEVVQMMQVLNEEDR